MDPELMLRSGKTPSQHKLNHALRIAALVSHKAQQRRHRQQLLPFIR